MTLSKVTALSMSNYDFAEKWIVVKEDSVLNRIALVIPQETDHLLLVIQTDEVRPLFQSLLKSITVCVHLSEHHEESLINNTMYNLQSYVLESRTRWFMEITKQKESKTSSKKDKNLATLNFNQIILKFLLKIKVREHSLKQSVVFLSWVFGVVVKAVS